MIQLQPFTNKDFDTLISWVGNEEELLQFSGPDFKFPLTREQLAVNISEQNRHPYAIVDASSGKMIAYAEIYVTRENTGILGRILIGDPEMRGHGIGVQIVQELLFISYTILGVKNTSLYVFDWNIGAIKCYEKAGFVINLDKTANLVFKGQTLKLLTMEYDRKNES